MDFERQTVVFDDRSWREVPWPPPRDNPTRLFVHRNMGAVADHTRFGRPKSRSPALENKKACSYIGFGRPA
jgi:hypothetical protein